MGWVVNATSRPLYPREGPGTQCVEGQVGPRASLDWCGNSHLPLGFDPQTVQPVASRYTDSSIPAHTDWTVRGSNSCRGKGFSSSQKRPDRLRGPPSLLYSRYSTRVLSRAHSGQTVKLTTRVHLVPRWRMSGALPPLLHGRVAWGRKTLPFIICVCVCVRACSA